MKCKLRVIKVTGKRSVRAQEHPIEHIYARLKKFYLVACNSEGAEADC